MISTQVITTSMLFFVYDNEQKVACIINSYHMHSLQLHLYKSNRLNKKFNKTDKKHYVFDWNEYHMCILYILLQNSITSAQNVIKIGNIWHTKMLFCAASLADLGHQHIRKQVTWYL